MTRPGHRPAGLLVGAVAALAVTAAPASAHIQMAPSVVAPGDSAKFTVLVPGEREQPTTRVELKVPSGVLPFSYENTPGWTRKLVEAANGAVDRVVWTGRMPRDGFVEFSFLAGMPDKTGTLSWKALQTYSDGTVVRWIGTPDSEHPAPVTRIVKGAAKQNAGGENGSGEPPVGGAATTPNEPTTSGETATALAAAGDGSDADWVARGIGIAAVVAFALVGVQLWRQARHRTNAA